MNADNYDNDYMSYDIANIVQCRPKIALEIQLDGKDAIEIIHNVVIDDQGNQIFGLIKSKEILLGRRVYQPNC